jgi:hypothetical protein
LIEKKQFVYRLLDDRNNVLYVGQHTGIHPAARVDRHQSKPWWPEVARWDYEEITGDLNAAEYELIQFWSGYYNKETQQFRAVFETMPTAELLFEAGQSAGEYRHALECRLAGKLKLIRAVLWRRDQTVVPPCVPWSERPKDFSQSWDFTDFPALSPNGFIRTMGCFQPADFDVAHPQCGFEIDHHPTTSRITDGSAKWKKYVDNAFTEGCEISYTGSYRPVEQSANRPAA